MNAHITENRNFLAPTNWKAVIDQEKYVNTAFFCVDFSIPSVSCTEVPTNFRGQQGFVPGDHVVYESLTLKFMVDENMVNYQEMFNWILSNVGSAKPIKHDILLSVLTSKNNENQKIRFANCFPTGLSPISFTTQANGTIEYISCDVTLKYDYFKFEV